jgi:hypothetical protein
VRFEDMFVVDCCGGHVDFLAFVVPGSGLG